MSHPLVHTILNRRNFLLFILAAFVAFAVWYLGDLAVVNETLKQVFQAVAAYDQRQAAIIFVLLAATSAMLTFFTSTPLVPIAIALWGVWPTFVLLMGGWLLGGMFAYCVGRMASELLKGLKLFHRIESYRRRLEGATEFIVVALFCLAVPSEMASYTLGILRYSFPLFAISIFIADLPFAILALYSSSALFGREPLLFLGFLIIGGVMMAVAIFLFYQRLRAVRRRRKLT